MWKLVEGEKGPSEKRTKKKGPNKLDQPLRDREMALSNLTRLGPEFVVPDMARNASNPAVAELACPPLQYPPCDTWLPLAPGIRPGERKRKQGGGGVVSPSRYITSKESKSQPRTMSPALGRRLLWDKTRWGRAIVGSGYPKSASGRNRLERRRPRRAIDFRNPN